MIWTLTLALTLILFQEAGAPTPPSEARLSEGYYRLTVTVEDVSRGLGVAGIDCVLKLRRGFLFLGRKKKDLMLRTDKEGSVTIHGLPEGKVELLLHLDKGRPQKYEADLQPGLRNRVQLHAGRHAITIEWVRR